MIKSKDLSKIFETKDTRLVAVDNINLDIGPGKIVGLLGPNGAGKTTSIRLLSTVYRPTSGGAIVAGFDIIKDPLSVRSSIGISTETPTIYPRLTAMRNLQYFADLYDVDRNSRDEMIEELLMKFDLYDVKDKPVSSYSKGMTQKVSIIKAVLHDPSVLMLDEPWSGLSPEATRDLREFIVQLANKDRSILISTHNLVQAEMIVDQLIIINRGRVIIDSTPDKLRKQYSVNPIIKMRLDNFNDDIVSNLDFVRDVKTVNNHHTFFIDSFEQTPDLVKHLVSEKARIHTIEEVIPSLEDIYLQLLDKEELR